MTRFLTAPTIRSSAVPEVGPIVEGDRSGEIIMAGFAEGLKAISEQLYPTVAAERKQEAQAEAQRDVDAGGFTIRRGAFTVRDVEYNRAGAQMAAGRIEADSVGKILELARQHRADPGAFAAGLRSYAAGVRAELLPINPELAEAVANRITSRGAPFVERAGSEAAAIVKDKADAALVALDASTTALMDEYARNLFAKDPAVAATAAQAMDRVIAEWSASLEKVDPITGKPLYTETEKAKALLEIRRRAVEIGVSTYLRETDDLPGAVTALVNGDLKLTVDGVAVDVSGILEPQRYKAVLVEAESLLRERNTAANAAERATDDALKAASRARRFELISSIAETGFTPGVLDVIRTDVKEGRLSPEDAEAVTKYAESRADGGQAKSDPAIEREINRRLYVEGEDARDYIMEHAHLLSPDDLRLYLERSHNMFGAATPEKKKDPKAFYESSLRNRLRSAETVSPSLFNVSQRRLTRAMEEYYIRVWDNGEDPKAVHDEIERRSREDFSAIGPDAPVLRPRFEVLHTDGTLNLTRTLDATADAVLNGTLSGELAEMEVVRVQAWAKTMNVNIDGWVRDVMAVINGG